MDLDPLTVMQAAERMNRTVRGFLGRKKATAARRAQNSKKRRKESRFVPSRPNNIPSYSVGADTGLGLAMRMGLQYNDQLPVPEFDPNNVSGRDSVHVNVKGYRICRTFYTTATSGGTGDCGPVEVNWALIQWECPISDSSVQTLLPQNFFRTSEFVDTKSVKFGSGTSDNDAYPLAGDPWTNKIICLPMNPDNGYKIITRRKRLILPRAGALNLSDDGKQVDNHWKIEYYQPIGS
jgi:hypothetical protein